MIFRVARPLPVTAPKATSLLCRFINPNRPPTTPHLPRLPPHNHPFTTTTTPRRTTMSDLPTDRRPLVISGPSGVGKGTLFGLLQQRHPDVFTLSVSHTTRAPRDGESDGTHYHFVTHGDFESLIDADGFVEHAQFSGNRYGTSKQAIRELTERGRVVVLDIEMEGVKQIKASGMDARYVFVSPPSEEELEKRLRGRGTEKEESVLKRLKQAKLELDFSKTPGVHDLIVSDPPPAVYAPSSIAVGRPTDSFDHDRLSMMTWRKPTSS